MKQKIFTIILISFIINLQQIFASIIQTNVTVSIYCLPSFNGYLILAGITDYFLTTLLCKYMYGNALFYQNYTTAESECINVSAGYKLRAFDLAFLTLTNDDVYKFVQCASNNDNQSIKIWQDMTTSADRMTTVNVFQNGTVRVSNDSISELHSHFICKDNTLTLSQQIKIAAHFKTCSSYTFHYNKTITIPVNVTNTSLSTTTTGLTTLPATSNTTVLSITLSKGTSSSTSTTTTSTSSSTTATSTTTSTNSSTTSTTTITTTSTSSSTTITTSSSSINTVIKSNISAGTSSNKSIIWSPWYTERCTIVKKRRLLTNSNIVDVFTVSSTSLMLCDFLDKNSSQTFIEQYNMKMSEERDAIINKTTAILSEIETKYKAMKIASVSFAWLTVSILAVFILFVLLNDLLKVISYLFKHKRTKTVKIGKKNSDFQLDDSIDMADLFHRLREQDRILTLKARKYFNRKI